MFTITRETSAHTPAVERLVVDTFGEEMKTRAAWHLRQGVAHEDELAFVAETDGRLVGTVSCTPIRVGDARIQMLGPLAVVPDLKGAGIGKALMARVMERARELPEAKTGGLILLVGDYDYYCRFGFGRVPERQIELPRRVDYARVLVCELVPGRLRAIRGMASQAI